MIVEREVGHWYGSSSKEPDRVFKLVEIDEENGYLKWQMIRGGWILTTTHNGMYVKGLNFVSETHIDSEFSKEEYAFRFLSDEGYRVFTERNHIIEELNELQERRIKLEERLTELDKICEE